MIAVLGTALLFAAVSVVPTSAPSTVVSREIHSTNFAQSKIGTSPRRALQIYLPPGYDDSASRYPVVYFFPDAFAGYSDPFEHKGAQALFDHAIAAGMIGKFILVAVDMNTSLGSSWCVNSPATGNWEDFVIDELKPYIDANFRTLPKRDS